MLLLFCQTCCKGFTTYRKWITHLLSSVHQKKARNKIKDWSKKLQSRGIIFTEFCKPKEEIDQDVISKLAWSVSEHTIISDLYFDCDKQVCVILIDEKKGAEYIVGMTDEIEAGIYQPFKRLATDISQSDWEAIFKKRDKKKLIKDLSGSNCVREVDVVANCTLSKTEFAVIEIDSEENENDCEFKNDLQSGDKAVSENSFVEDVKLKNSITGDVTLEKRFAEDVNLEKSFAEDVTLEEDFLITDKSVLESFNDSVITNDCEPEESEKNGETSDLNDEFAAFMKANLLSRDAVKTRKMVVRQLAQILQDYYKGAKVYPFEDGLKNLNFLKTSSLVVGIDINGNFNGSGCPVTMSKQDMMKIRELLCSSKPDGSPFCINLYKNIFQRGFSLNFTHYRSKMECECFFFRKMSQQKWKFVSACMEADPRSLPLTQFLVSWYEKYLSDFGHGQSELPNKFMVYYPFIQLVIYFLIYKGIIPTMGCWQNSFAHKVQIKNENVGFCEDIPEILRQFEQPQECVYSKNDTNVVTGKPSAKCILGLAAGFFEYFGVGNLEKNIVSLPIGALVKKEGLLIKRKGAFYGAIFRDKEQRKSILKLGKYYRELSKNSRSFTPTSFIVQDSCDQQTYEFSQQWSTKTLSDFQNHCCSTSLAIKSVLYGNSSLSDLWSFFPSNSKTDNNLIKSFGFISKSRRVIKSHCFNVPRVVTVQLRTLGKGIQKFWFHVLKEFFDKVLEGVLKLHIKSTHVEDEEESHNYIEHNNQVESKPSTYYEETEDIVPKKKQKRNSGNAVSEENPVAVNIYRVLSKMKLPYGALYTKTYFAESRCSKLILGLAKRIKPTRKRSYVLKNPLVREKTISDSLMDDETEDAFEMTWKILIDCRTLVAGIQIEGPCDDQGANITKLREITAFIGALATKYILYRAQEFKKDHNLV